jgi:hypothetical protein
MEGGGRKKKLFNPARRERQILFESNVPSLGFGILSISRRDPNGGVPTPILKSNRCTGAVIAPLSLRSETGSATARSFFERSFAFGI